MLQYVIGDVLNDYPCLKRRIICQVNNDCGKYGAGFSGAISKKYPKVEEEYKKWARFKQYMLGTQTIPFKLGQIQIVPVEKLTYVVNMIGQHDIISPDNPKPIKYAALIRCMEKVKMFAEKIDGEIHSPFFGTGFAKGTPEFIEELINEIWKDFPVYIYKLKE